MENIPSELRDPLNRIVVEIDLYIETFTKQEQRMTEIKDDFYRIGSLAREILRIVQVTGLVVGAVGLVGALFTGGASLALTEAGSLLALITEMLLNSGNAKKNPRPRE